MAAYLQHGSGIFNDSCMLSLQYTVSSYISNWENIVTACYVQAFEIYFSISSW
jgi:hypothetical protein